MRSCILALVAVSCTLLVSETEAAGIDDIRSALVKHVTSGAQPDAGLWSRYVAAYKDSQKAKTASSETVEIPKFKWSQTKSKLAITVTIPGVKDEKVEFGDDTVTVSGKGRNGKSYGLDLKLAKAIKKGTFSVDSNGAIYLNMRKKKKEAYWPRLLHTKPTGELKRKMEVDWANWVDEEDLAEDDDDDVDEEDVKVLTTENFDSWVGSQKVSLVEFYAPWCGHCKQLKPAYALAATELKEKGSSARLAKVDATKEQSLGSRFGVSGYPSLKVFRARKGVPKATEYKGGRSQVEIVSYMTKQEQPGSTLLGGVEAVKDWATREKPAVVGFFAKDAEPNSYSNKMAELYSDIADELREEFTFGHMEGSGKEFDDSLDPASAIVLFRPDGSHIPYPEDKELPVGVGETKPRMSMEAMKHWILLNTLPTVGDLDMDASLEAKYAERKLPIIFLFTDPTDKAGTKALLGAGAKLADSLYGKYSVVTMKTTQKERMESLGAPAGQIPDPTASMPDDWSEEDDGPWEAPSVDDPRAKVVLDSVGGKMHYVLPADRAKDGITYEVLESFVRDHEECVSDPAKCQLSKNVKSAPVPESNNGPVKVVVGSTFEEVVMDDKKDVLIEFYAPWCGHCKSLAPIYEDLGKKMSKSTELVIGKMDATANDIPNEKFDVTGFPTMYFKPAGKDPELYEGGRDLSSFVSYLKSKATNAIVE